MSILDHAALRQGIEQKVSNERFAPESAQHIRASIERTFGRARWELRPDGTFLFTPSAEANRRSDLYPLHGTYEQHEAYISFGAVRRSELGAVATVDGVLIPDLAGYRLHAVHAVASGMNQNYAYLSQGLSTEAPSEGVATQQVGGLKLPLRYSITIEGQSDGETLPTQNGLLAILPGSPGAEMPLVLNLSTTNTDQPGTLLWSSPPEIDTEGVQTRLQTQGEELVVEVEAQAGEILAPLWIVSTSDAALAGLPSMVGMIHGRLELHLGDGSLRGRVSATGRSILGKDSSYEATLHGEQLPAGWLPAPAVGPAHTSATGQNAAMSPPAALEPWDLQIRLSGTTDTNDFSDLPGRLLLIPDGTQFYDLTLTTEGEAQVGGTTWFSAKLPAGELLRGGWAELRYEPKEPAVSAVSWYTSSAHPQYAGLAVTAVPQWVRIRLRQDGKGGLQGEIEGEGLTLIHEPESSSYNATLRGTVPRKQGLERWQQALNQQSMAGEWRLLRLGDGAASVLTLQQEGHRLLGSLHLPDAAAHLRGSVGDGRAELDWQLSSGKRGTLILRSAIPGEVMTGLWLEAGWQDDGGPQPLIAVSRPSSPVSLPLKGLHQADPRREDSSAQTTATAGEQPQNEPTIADARLGKNSGQRGVLSIDEADELRRLASSLINEGRCGAAVPMLEQSWEAYRVAAELDPKGRMGLSSHVHQAPMVRIFDMITLCDLQLRDKMRLLHHLHMAVEELRGLQLGSISGPALEQEVESWLTEVETSTLLIKIFAEHFQRLQTQARKEGSIAEQAVITTAFQQLDSLYRGAEDSFSNLRDQVKRAKHGHVAPAVVLRHLDALRPDLRTRARKVFATLRAQGIPLLQQDRELQQRRDALWRTAAQIFRQPDDVFQLDQAEASAPAPETLIEVELGWQRALEQHPSASSLSRELAFQHTRAGVQLLALGRPDREIEPVLRERRRAWVRSANHRIMDTAEKLTRQADHWRSYQPSDKDKRQALAEAQDFYSELIHLLVQTESPREALVVSEAARGRAFADLLLGREQIRERAKGHVTRSRSGLPSPTSARLPSFDSLMAVVKERDSTTVQYFLSDRGLILWVIRPTGELEMIPLDVNHEELEADVHNLVCMLEERKYTEQRSARMERLLKQLHQTLIAPIPQHLLPSDPEQPLTLIPHGELFKVPFAALEDEAGQPLIARHALTFGVSIETLGFMGQQEQRAAPQPPYATLTKQRRSELPRMLALVNPQPMPLEFPALADGNEPQRHCEGTNSRFELHPLPRMKAMFEEQIVPLFASNELRVLFGKEASKEALWDSGRDYGLLFLATHAKFQGRGSDDSFIALADDPRGSGLLRVSEVYDLELNAELVILGACQTGLGGIDADGVGGLGRAFAWAGASSLVLSLWSIPAESSTGQLASFLRLWLHKGLSRAAALRRVQLNYSQLYPDQPDLWAGLVHYG